MYVALALCVRKQKNNYNFKIAGRKILKKILTVQKFSIVYLIFASLDLDFSEQGKILTVSLVS